MKRLEAIQLAVVTGGQSSDAYTPMPGDGAVHIDWSKPAGTECYPHDNMVTHNTELHCVTSQKFEDSTLFKPQRKN
jgi:hypothetical protein